MDGGGELRRVDGLVKLTASLHRVLRQLQFPGQVDQLFPGRVLDLNAITATLGLLPVLDFTGIEHASAADGRWRRSGNVRDQ